MRLRLDPPDVTLTRPELGRFMTLSLYDAAHRRGRSAQRTLAEAGGR